MTNALHRLGATTLLTGLLGLGATFGGPESAWSVRPEPEAPADALPSLSAEAAIAELAVDDMATREAAAKALRLHAEAGDPAAISALIDLLSATSSKLRYEASWGLVGSGAAAVPELRAAFARESQDERRAVIAHALGRIGLAARAAAPELIESLDDPHSETAIRAAYALGAMRVRGALPALVRTYSEARKLSSQREVARAIEAIGSDQAAREARDALVSSLDTDLASPDARLRAESIVYAVELLRVVNQDAPDSLPTREALAAVIPQLERALDDPNADTLAIVRGLGYAGGNAAAAVPRLEALLEDPDVAREAEHALAAIATPDARRILSERAALAALEKRIRVEYSLLDHQGRVRLLPFYVIGRGTEGVRMETRFLYTGDQIQHPTHIIVAFESFSAEARFASLSRIDWHADGRQISMRGVDRSLGSSSLGVIERLSALLPVEEFLALVAAERIGGRLASIDFELSAKDRAALRHFAGKIPVAAPASPASGP
jgi:HEAT repeat protein